VIRFSAFLVAVAVGLLVAGVVTSKLALVYVAIGVSGLALLALGLGALLKRNELSGASARPEPPLPEPAEPQLAPAEPQLARPGSATAPWGAAVPATPTTAMPRPAAGPAPAPAAPSEWPPPAAPSEWPLPAAPSEWPLPAAAFVPSATSRHAEPPPPAAPAEAFMIPQPEPAASTTVTPEPPADTPEASLTPDAPETPDPSDPSDPPEAASQAVDLEREVTVVPGVPRYHNTNCLLIRFMGQTDLEKMTLGAARQAGCTPCRACLPDQGEGDPDLRPPEPVRQADIALDVFPHRPGLRTRRLTRARRDLDGQHLGGDQPGMLSQGRGHIRIR
jgi:hypothetical protein